MPWITTLVVSSTKMLTLVPVLSRGRLCRGQADGPAGGFEHGGLGDERGRQVVGQERTSLDGVGAVQAHDDRRAQLDPPDGLDDALRHLVDPRDATEDVDENGL